MHDDKKHEEMRMTKEIAGLELPNIILPSTDKKDLRIPADLIGSYTVLFFYPKDLTFGCTKEACNFRDNTTEFKALNAKIFGVSADSLESHERFINKHALNFPLLCDTNKELAKALGVSSFLGMLSRDTFLIDPSGKVIKTWRKVNPSNTVSESLEELKKQLSAP